MENPYFALEQRLYQMHRDYHPELPEAKARELAKKETLQLGLLTIMLPREGIEELLQRVNAELDTIEEREKAKLAKTRQPLPKEPVTRKK